MMCVYTNTKITVRPIVVLQKIAVQYAAMTLMVLVPQRWDFACVGVNLQHGLLQYVDSTVCVS